MSHLPASYAESSARFRSTAAAAGANLAQYVHPTEEGPDGQPLTVDVALFGRSDARKVFFNINGVHGLESFPGAGAQIALIESGALAALPGDCAALLIHCLNPFGWVYGCQRNESNVDINRNFIDFAAAPRTGKVVDEIAQAIAIDTMSFGALDGATRKLAAISNGASAGSVTRAIMTGQFEDPDGLKYGGSCPEWSNDVLRDTGWLIFTTGSYASAFVFAAGIYLIGLVTCVAFGTGKQIVD